MNEQAYEEEAADRLWYAIIRIQAMTDRLLTRYAESVRDRDTDAYSLTVLAAHWKAEGHPRPQPWSAYPPRYGGTTRGTRRGGPEGTAS